MQLTEVTTVTLVELEKLNPRAYEAQKARFVEAYSEDRYWGDEVKKLCDYVGKESGVVIELGNSSQGYHVDRLTEAPWKGLPRHVLSGEQLFRRLSKYAAKKLQSDDSGGDAHCFFFRLVEVLRKEDSLLRGVPASLSHEDSAFYKVGHLIAKAMDRADFDEYERRFLVSGAEVR